MSKRNLQRKYFINIIIGCFVIPIVLFLPKYFIGFEEYNFTGLLTEQKYAFVFHFLSVILLVWLHQMIIFHLPQKKKEIRISSLLILFALFFPYAKDNQIISTIHIMSAYAAFIFFNMLFFQILFMHRNYMQIYLCVLAFVFMHSFVHGAVTGVSEVAWASGVSIIISLIR
ncbi:MAG: hypothetical protein IKR11_12250 [Solobacterium sp.]|nr:hypothetical protein [Solobacterium sp.]